MLRLEYKGNKKGVVKMKELVKKLFASLLEVVKTLYLMVDWCVMSILKTINASTKSRFTTACIIGAIIAFNHFFPTVIPFI